MHQPAASSRRAPGHPPRPPAPTVGGCPSTRGTAQTGLATPADGCAKEWLGRSNKGRTDPPRGGAHRTWAPSSTRANCLRMFCAWLVVIPRAARKWKQMWLTIVPRGKIFCIISKESRLAWIILHSRQRFAVGQGSQGASKFAQRSRSHDKRMSESSCNLNRISPISPDTPVRVDARRQRTFNTTIAEHAQVC